MTASRRLTTILAAVLAIATVLACSLALADTAYAAKPAKAKIASVASNAPGQVTVKVKKAKRAKGYQVWASTSRKFDRGPRYDLESAKSKKQAVMLDGLKEGRV